MPIKRIETTYSVDRSFTISSNGTPISGTRIESFSDLRDWIGMLGEEAVEALVTPLENDPELKETTWVSVREEATLRTEFDSQKQKDTYIRGVEMILKALRGEDV